MNSSMTLAAAKTVCSEAMVSAILDATLQVRGLSMVCSTTNLDAEIAWYLLFR